MMARWTNDHWLSTLHRVANPPEEALGGNRRLSVVFFHHPNYDTVVECLPTCTGPGDPPKYGPVTVADYYVLKREQHKGAPAKNWHQVQFRVELCEAPTRQWLNMTKCNVRFRPKADIASIKRNVGFTLESGHSARTLFVEGAQLE